MGMGRDLMGRRKDGTTFPIEVGLSSVVLDETLLGVACVSDISERKAAEEKIAVQNERLRHLTQNLTNVAEGENRKWARELHDVYSQRLVGIAMELARLGQGKAAAPEFERLLSQIRAMAEDIHHLSRRMHPSILHDLGLVAALRAEVKAFERECGIRTRFRATAVPDHVSDDVRLCLYRVVQETLRNIRKHSRAKRAEVSLSAEPGRLTMVIEDTGDGFDLDRALKKGGLGLISMEERVVSVGGEFCLESVPDVGTTVRVVVPVPGTRRGG
jgi:signal transduction histidine kinase